MSKDDCSGLGAAYKNACTPQCVCCVRPECVLCGVCSMCALRVHVRTHVCQGTPFSVCLMSMSAHVSRRVCTWALMACVHVLMCVCALVCMRKSVEQRSGKYKSEPI